MRPRSISVSQLAREIGSDVDSVLLATWDLDHVDDRALDVLNSSDKIPGTLVEKVRSSLGIATRRELNTVNYWCNLLGLSIAELRAKLSEEGYSLGPKQRRLPHGTRKFLIRLARARQIDPLTGETAAALPVKRVTSRKRKLRQPTLSFGKVGRRPRTFQWLSVAGRVEDSRCLSC